MEMDSTENDRSDEELWRDNVVQGLAQAHILRLETWMHHDFGNPENVLRVMHNACETDWKGRKHLNVGTVSPLTKQQIDRNRQKKCRPRPANEEDFLSSKPLNRRSRSRNKKMFCVPNESVVLQFLQKAQPLELTCT